MKNTAYHQAHLMAEDVSKDIQQLKSKVLAKVDSIVTPHPVSSESPVPSIPQPHQQFSRRPILPLAHLTMTIYSSLHNFSNNFLLCRMQHPLHMVVTVSLINVVLHPSTVAPMGLVFTPARTSETGKTGIVMKQLLQTNWAVALTSAKILTPDGVGWNVHSLVEIIIMIGL